MSTTVDHVKKTSSEPSAPIGSRPNAAWRWIRGDGPGTLLFLLPLIVIFGLFAWWPIVRSLPLSLQETNLIDPAQWVGLANFEAVLSDPLLWTAVRNTLWFVILALVIGFPIPLALAVVLSEFRRGRGVASVLAYLPVILPPVSVILLWKLFYDPRPTGLFNTIAGWVGLGPFPWLERASSVMPSIVVMATWASFGTATIIYLAALTSVRTELYEAAEIDGATVWQRVWHVTLPQLRIVVLIMLLLQVVGTFQVFAQPYVMTGGGPENASITLIMLVFEYAFVSGRFGVATALSLMLAVVLAAISGLYFLVTKKWSTV